MKFSSDVIFEDFPTLFCEELAEGFQVFHSWSEFLTLIIEHPQANCRPLYAFKADIVDDLTITNVFVDATQIVEIPWNELENYI